MSEKPIFCPYCGVSFGQRDMDVQSEEQVRDYFNAAFRVTVVGPPQRDDEHVPLHALASETHQETDEYRKLEAVADGFYPEEEPTTGKSKLVTESWWRAPCSHLLPVGWMDACRDRRASVIALSGAPSSGKTHLLAMLARTLKYDIALQEALAFQTSTLRCQVQWKRYEQTVLGPLLYDGSEVTRTSINRDLSSLGVMFELRPTGRNVKPAWIALTDAPGELTTEDQIREHGHYLSAATTNVVCLSMEDLLGLMSVPGYESKPSEVQKLREAVAGYFTTLLSVITDEEFAELRRKCGHPEMSKLILAATRADKLETILKDKDVQLYDRFMSAYHGDEGEDAAGSSSRWNRHLFTSVLLDAAGLAAIARMFEASFFEPVYTMVSSTGQDPVDGHFNTNELETVNLEGILMEHLHFTGFADFFQTGAL